MTWERKMWKKTLKSWNSMKIVRRNVNCSTKIVMMTMMREVELLWEVAVD
jgi:hypothetical protein